MATLLTLVGLLFLCGLSLSNGCRRELLVNVDFPGQDITILFSPDAEHCQQLCTQHSSCRFFSFIRPDSTRTSNFYCYLKSSSSGQPNVQKAILGITSGYSLKPCYPDPLPCLPHVYHDVDFPGADFRTLFTADYEECQKACTSDPACQFFAFLTHTFPDPKVRYKCYLKVRFFTLGITRHGSVISGFSHRVHTTQNFNTDCCVRSLIVLFYTACEGKLFPNTDITMHSINVPLAASPEHCQALCSAHPLCASFTYVSADFKCHMKGSTQEMITRAVNGFTSGLPARFCQLDNKWLKKNYAGINFPHNDIRSFVVDNVETCQRTCTEDPNCQFFSYVANKPPARNLCYLKRVITMPAPPRIIKLANIVSGFSLKNCHYKVIV
ncbi:coagulation factor XI-like [Larimichthys crocea]|uniref:coagulation factor XI-like n=1 Tax=Larimichthys crocea TaxID=215358 RepID=UPI000F5ED2AA|nr:coagulation factor XI-like [Larimichthys crocea]